MCATAPTATERERETQQNTLRLRHVLSTLLFPQLATRNLERGSLSCRRLSQQLCARIHSSSSSSPAASSSSLQRLFRARFCGREASVVSFSSGHSRGAGCCCCEDGVWISCKSMKERQSARLAVREEERRSLDAKTATTTATMDVEMIFPFSQGMKQEREMMRREEMQIKKEEKKKKEVRKK